MHDEAPALPAQQSARWLLLAGLGATLIITTLIALLAVAGRQRDADLRLQEASFETIILAASLDATIARSEAALGRFVISGERRLGGLYADDWRRAEAVLDRLGRATRGDRDQSARVARLRTAYRLRGSELGQAALRTTYAQNSEALATYYRIRTSDALTVIGRDLAALTAHERNRLRDRSRAAEASLARANRFAAALSVLGLLLLAGGGALAAAIVRAAGRRRQEAARTEELEDAVALRTAELSTAHDALIVEMATREAAEAQLRQAQKMDAVGQLTGGIAHNFNNMLAVVLGGVELAKRRIADGRGDPARHLDHALEGAHRAAALTKRLLAFARAEPLLPLPTDPDALIAGMAEMIDRTLGERIAVRHVPGADGTLICVDRHQLENALLNLAVNARDAMAEQGGTLTIATAVLSVADGIIDLPGGAYVRIAVSDSGSGIEPANMARIFEPFFTTKPVDRGTGLGLSQIFGYVRQSGGTVTVDSAVGVGTTVSLYLPPHDGVVTADDAGLPMDEPHASRLRILVVEDDRRVLASTVDALSELGHTAIACNHPDLARAAMASGTIDLILSDVLMPGTTGPELVARLRRERPMLRSIYATGYVGDGHEAEAFGGDVVLRKPFTLASLADAIARTMAQRDTMATLVTADAA